MKNIIKNHMHDLVNQMFTDSKKDSENQTTSESEINNNSKS